MLAGASGGSGATLRHAMVEICLMLPGATRGSGATLRHAMVKNCLMLPRATMGVWRNIAPCFGGKQLHGSSLELMQYGESFRHNNVFRCHGGNSLKDSKLPHSKQTLNPPTGVAASHTVCTVCRLAGVIYTSLY